MEKICIRFPHLIEQINKVLDFKTLVNFKEVNRIVCTMIDNQKQGKFFWTRVIQTNLLISNCIEFEEDWKNVLRKTESEYLKKIAINVKKMFTSRPERRQSNWSPMHIASAQEDLELCKKIAEITEERNPKLKDDWAPLHFAAQIGNCEIYKFLSENLQDMNPGTNIGITPLHLAATNGHLEMYKFICESAMDKNPVMDGEITPLHLAAKHNQIDVCKFICENVHNVSPKIGANDLLPSLTPLTFAINRGNVKVSKLIIKYDYQVCSTFLGFIFLGFLCFFILSIVVFWIATAIASADCEKIWDYQNRKYHETKCDFLVQMLTQSWIVYLKSPYAWPYLLYGRFVFLYFRDMYLTNYIDRTFDW